MLVLLFALYTCVFLYYFNTLLCCKDISHMNSVPFDDDFKCFVFFENVRYSTIYRPILNAYCPIPFVHMVRLICHTITSLAVSKVWVHHVTPAPKIDVQ